MSIVLWPAGFALLLRGASSNALRNILKLDDREEKKITTLLTDVLEKSRKA